MTPPGNLAPIAAARAALARAHRVAVLTGAGMSAESGVPTFRDAQTGLWARFDPHTLASAEGFAADPALVWRWYAWRRERVAQAQPHAGHRALAAAQESGRFGDLTLITQNVDGLHAAAGSRGVLELHGNLMSSHCSAGCGVAIARPADLPAGEPPGCPRCGGHLRPSVVWFGEALEPATLQRAQAAAVRSDAMLVIGTSGLVQPAAALPGAAQRAGSALIVVNPQPSELDHLAAVVIRAGAAAALPLLLEDSES
ncbi:MAG: SIR2 family NAD-dependent protein deacylase [Burkholderiaceae bacterium]